MGRSHNRLNPDLIYSLYTGGFKPHLVRIALLIDVFTPLAHGPLDIPSMAKMCSCDERGIEILLDYLTSLGLLIKEEARYRLTPTAEAFLVKDKKTYAGAWLLMETDPEFWQYVSDRIKGKVTSYENVPWSQDAMLESYRESRIPQSLEMWRLAGFVSGFRSKLRILDLGSGCAIKSFALAEKDASIKVTCVDSKQVLEIAKDLAQRMDIEAQVVFVPGDILHYDFKNESYEAVLLGQITDYFTSEQNENLFMHIYDTLVTGGKLIVNAPMSKDVREEAIVLVSLLTWSLSGGRAYSFPDYEKWLSDVGFREIKRLSDNWLCATK